MATNFDDKSKYNSIARIRDAKDGNKDVFTKEEKQEFFFDPLIIGDTERARAVAKLLIKVKDYKTIKKSNLGLVGELENEKKNNTVSYRVANKNYLVDSAIAWLKELNRIGTDIPTDKAAREAKIKEYEGEISKIQGVQGPRETRSIELRLRKRTLEEEKLSLKGASDRWESFIRVLNVETNPSAKIVDIHGQEKTLNDASLKIKYKDYDGGNITNFNNDGSENVTKIGTEVSVEVAVKKANSFLEVIANESVNEVKFTWPQTWEESKVSYFNERKFNNKNNLTTGFRELGFSFLKVLRDIGADNLKKAVKKSSSSKKDELEKVADEIVKYISWAEVFTDDIGNTLDYLDWTKMSKATDDWHETLLRRGKDEFPYVSVPDYKKIFFFMKEVFPVELNSSKDRVLKVKDADYLDKETDSSYLRPSDTSKNGWSDLWIGGFSESPIQAMTNAGVNANDYDNSIVQYTRENPSDTKISSKLKSQISSEPVPDSWKFKSLVELWWNSFIPFMKNPDPSSNDYSFKNNNITYDQAVTNKYLYQLRYCKTMRSIFEELKLLSQPDEFDIFLLEIADMAQKGQWINPRSEILKRNKGFYQDNGKEIELFKKVRDKEIWGNDYDYKNFGPSLVSLANKSKSRISYVDSEIGTIDKQIALLDEKNAEDQIKIDDYNSKITLLRALGDDEELPTDDKKKAFQKLYDKKDARPEKKWLYYDEILRMIQLLKWIKAEIDDSEFTKDFATKETELGNLKKEIDEINTEIENNWECVKKSGDNELTDSETIIKIKKEGVERDITLEKAKESFEKLKEKVILRKIEKDALDKIIDAITHPENYQDKVPSPSGITKEELKQLFSLEDADDALKNKWNTSLEAQSITKDKINSIIVNDYGPGKAKHDNLLSHLVDTGDGFEGTKDAANYKSGTPEEKKTTWKKFIEKGPEVVIKTIVNHEFEDKKDDERKKMEDDKNSDGQPLKDDVYKKGSDGKFEDASVKQYMYEKKIGKSHQFAQKPQNDDDRGGGNTPQEMSVWKEWFGFGVAWKSTIAYVGILLLIAAVLGVIFWQNITDWWNGPAEEHGKSETDEEEKEEE